MTDYDLTLEIKLRYQILSGALWTLPKGVFLYIHNNFQGNA